MLESGIDVDDVDGDGLTALEIAIRGCDENVEDTAVEMLAVLLNAGADVDKPDSEGLSPLDRAASQNNALLVAYLLERRASYSDNLWTMEDISVDIL